LEFGDVGGGDQNFVKERAAGEVDAVGVHAAEFTGDG